MQPPDTNAKTNDCEKPEKNSQPLTHTFSRSFARTHGIKAAIVAGYLAHRIGATGKRAGEGYRCTLDDLHSHYPYMSRSAIATALKKMVGVVFTVHTKNWKPWDHTCHYAFVSNKQLQATHDDRVYFRVADAIKHGLTAALLLTNLRMRIDDEKAHGRLESRYRVCAREIAKHLPLTPTTISREFSKLMVAEGLKVHRCAGFDRAYEIEVGPFLSDEAVPDSPAANQDSCDAVQNEHDTIPNVHDPEPHITNTLEVNIGSERSKSSIESFDSYEGRPASPTAERVCQFAIAEPEGVDSSSHAEGDTADQVGGVTGDNSVSAGSKSCHSGTQASCLASPLSTIDEQNPFGPLKPFIPPPRFPLPENYMELRRSIGHELHKHPCDMYWSLNRKVHAVIQQHGVGRVFRWLAIKDDQELFSVIREAVERCRCPKADLMTYNSQLGVDRFCAVWLVGACRAYLDDRLDPLVGPDIATVLGVLTQYLPAYYADNLAELEREGLAYLRYGKTVIAERFKSPDIEHEENVHLSAAEKARVFENAMISINRVGHCSTMYEITKCGAINITKTGLQLARRFFEFNPNWAVKDLLYVLKQCIDRNLERSKRGGFLEDFAACNGNNLTYFMRYLEKIIYQLEAQSHVPAVTFPKQWAMKEAA